MRTRRSPWKRKRHVRPDFPPTGPACLPRPSMTVVRPNRRFLTIGQQAGPIRGPLGVALGANKCTVQRSLGTPWTGPACVCDSDPRRHPPWCLVVCYFGGPLLAARMTPACGSVLLWLSRPGLIVRYPVVGVVRRIVTAPQECLSRFVYYNHPFYIAFQSLHFFPDPGGLSTRLAAPIL